jgi:dethiobiotin synthetase
LWIQAIVVVMANKANGSGGIGRQGMLGMQELRRALGMGKSLLVCFYPSWKRAVLGRAEAVVAEARQGEGQAGPMLAVEVRGGCAAEAYVVDHLGAKALPVLAIYIMGKLHFYTDDFLSTPSPGLGPALRLLPSMDQLLHCEVPLSDIINALFMDDEESPSPCLYLYMSGDRSSVGKSSLCWALLSILVDILHVPPNLLAYTKPATQCEALQNVTEYCRARGVEELSIGPVVFYSGFTRAFLSGETPSSAELLQQIQQSIYHLSIGKRLVLVDGVGYPSVGSICGVGNAQVCASLRLPVLLVGRPGVGDAVDSYNLHKDYFCYHGVHVLGAVFNKLEMTGFYARAQCESAVNSYFRQFQPSNPPYGFVPKVENSKLVVNTEGVVSDSG